MIDFGVASTCLAGETSSATGARSALVIILNSNSLAELVFLISLIRQEIEVLFVAVHLKVT